LRLLPKWGKALETAPSLRALIPSQNESLRERAISIFPLEVFRIIFPSGVFSAIFPLEYFPSRFPLWGLLPSRFPYSCNSHFHTLGNCKNWFPHGGTNSTHPCGGKRRLVFVRAEGNTRRCSSDGARDGGSSHRLGSGAVRGGGGNPLRGGGDAHRRVRGRKKNRLWIGREPPPLTGKRVSFYTS